MTEKIVLIGFAACYKSTVGKRLAESLNLKFVDTDKRIEAQIRMPISKIISEYGEEKFRAIESETIKSVAQLDGAVVSCGGGSVLSDEFETLAEKSVVLWLTASAETVRDRLNGRTRPLFDGLSLNELQIKIEERKNLYRKYASAEISTDGLTSMQVFEKALKTLKKFDA